MNHDGYLETLIDFRSDVGEPDDETARRIYRRATAGTAQRHRRRGSRRIGLGLAAGLIAVAVTASMIAEEAAFESSAPRHQRVGVPSPGPASSRLIVRRAVVPAHEQHWPRWSERRVVRVAAVVRCAVQVQAMPAAGHLNLPELDPEPVRTSAIDLTGRPG
jgi:hypothetical protein